MNQQVTVEVDKNGTVRVKGAAEYESSTVIQLALSHHANVSRINARSQVLQAFAPWICLVPVFLVLWTLILIGFRPAPTMPTQNHGSYHSHESV